MRWLATSDRPNVFIFLISPLLLQLVFEFVETFSNDVPAISSLAYSLLSLGLTLIWIREIGATLLRKAENTASGQLIFTLLCSATAIAFLYMGIQSILADDPEIFLQPSYLRPMFFTALFLFMGCVIFTASQIEKAETPKSETASIANIASTSILLAISLIGVWSIQPRVQNLLK